MKRCWVERSWRRVGIVAAVWTNYSEPSGVVRCSLCCGGMGVAVPWWEMQGVGEPYRNGLSECEPIGMKEVVRVIGVVVVVFDVLGHAFDWPPDGYTGMGESFWSILDIRPTYEEQFAVILA
ncbi:hypothetical protein Tco_0214957 [Tanacetum coccineum]